MRRIMIAIVLAACGDDRAPETCAADYGDAQVVWASAWCSYAERCFPVDFAREFPGGVAGCAVEIQESNCLMLAPMCEQAFPVDRCESLEQCELEMSAVSCDASSAPTSCYLAFDPPGF